MRIILLLLLQFASWSLGDPRTGHGYDTKSFTQAYLECLQYLNIWSQPMLECDTNVLSNGSGNCLLRCIGLNLRWWDDQTGLLERPLLPFFRQQPNTEMLTQARACVAKLDNTTAEPCAGAYNSFRCYSDVLGEVVAYPEYVVPSREEAVQIVRHCVLVLQVPPEQIANYMAAGSFLLDDKGTSVLRCIVTRLGLYSDGDGVLVHRLRLLQSPASPMSDAEVRLAKQCEANVRQTHADACHIAAHSVETCYGREAFAELWATIADEYGPVGMPFPLEEILQNTNHSSEQVYVQGKEDENATMNETQLEVPNNTHQTTLDEPREEESDSEQVFFYPARKGVYNSAIYLDSPLKPGIYVVPDRNGDDSADHTSTSALDDGSDEHIVPAVSSPNENTSHLPTSTHVEEDSPDQAP
ncbi:general odorant-binding protein 45-like [Anopheles ziemanni]|uniref:general odorant-binding protein 45-like n=1 Tax=Anopheles coustani TaxID=139045 RepID=UPI00265A415A|nr:general odorant-binding protein 45-like [Anopheles coustani]XP_058175700.1 general odorant-binding protein 45-like [Anopheles ziemanni]